MRVRRTAAADACSGSFGGAYPHELQFDQPRYAPDVGLINQLPAELKLLVFTRLGARELGALCCTSHEMRKQTAELWGNVFQHRWAGSRVSSCNLFSPLAAHGVVPESWQARYGQMELAERMLLGRLPGQAAERIELEGRLPRETSHVLQADIALSASLACCVCSGSSFNALHAWAPHSALTNVDSLHAWHLPSGKALPPIYLPSDPTGLGAPVVRVCGSVLYVAAAGSAQISAYRCEGKQPLLLFELRGHEQAIKALSVDDVLAASGSTDGTARVWDKHGGMARRVLSHSGPVVEVQLTGWRLVTQHLHVGAGQGRSTTLWDVHAGARLAIWDGWACLGPQSSRLPSTGSDGVAARVCVQGPVQLSLYDTHSVRLEHVLRHPGQERVCSSALAVSASYVISAIAPDSEEQEADDDVPAAGWHVAVWRVADGSFLGFLGPHPWEVETVSLLGHAAICLAYDNPPPHMVVWDLSRLPGEAATGVPISYAASPLAFAALGPRILVALSDGALVLTNLDAHLGCESHSGEDETKTGASRLEAAQEPS